MFAQSKKSFHDAMNSAPSSATPARRGAFSAVRERPCTGRGGAAARQSHTMNF
jgi:hypothetical protein